ncbi:MAG TPA: hypothetical protein DEP36_08365 [Gammaproteobacteria bacterium]|nr:hypothetical protein [Gammaproteobacteria bacterium]
MDPFYQWSSRPLHKSLCVSFIATLGCFLAIEATNRPLENDIAPLGILSLQFAGELSSALLILDSWGETARLHAAFNLGFDYLFLVVYALFLSAACSWLARARQPTSQGFATARFILAWAVFAAAALDMIENVALWQLLLGSMNAHWPILATACATVKFAIILTGIGYIVIGAWAVLIHRHRPTDS